MGRFFITGSSDGLGSLTAKNLVAKGHEVVLHARNPDRARDASAACPGALSVLVADLTSIDETKNLAAEANTLGPYEAVVHNAGLYTGYEKIPGKAGLPSLFTVNTLAPYILTCLMAPPKRLVYVSSEMHKGGKPNVGANLVNSNYSDSKLQDVLLAKAFSRKWSESGSGNKVKAPVVEAVYAADPGWVATKMGGSSAPDRIEDSVDTFTMLALGEGAAKGRSGGYFRDSKETKPAKVTEDVSLQERLLEELAAISGVAVPE
ncbi:hypothetical protein B0H63DRAFT_485531 [Podospora didyma]|uniref:Oxidoreductase n=1 Tax=Podospora didyma TaxID=330526 RepID=A0AAE0N7X1_9PEZI|nr:hypothetical protein B0H63DRAFT_485531 [Podospora didyma]